MDKFFSVNGFTFSTMTSFSLTLLASLFPVLCIFFNAVLLTVARMNRNCNTFPLAYVVVMGINGIIISIFVWFHCVTFLVLSESYYSAYLVWFGKETTLFATLSYLNYLLVCVLMTVNRIFAVAFPFRDIFTNFRIYILSVLICIVTFVSLAIPYFSPCYIVFNTRKLSFVSGCAPDRHPITLFQNQYFYLLPIICMIINLGIIAHVKWTRNKCTEKIRKLLFRRTDPTPSNVSTVVQDSTMSKMQSKREREMMRQTIIVAFYLSIYEFGGLAVKYFPNIFASLDPIYQQLYFYIRLESIPAMNIIIYYYQTGSTRRMIQKFLRWKINVVETSVRNTTVVPGPVTATHSKSRSPSPVE
ncbi:unnamed protein product [Caenorhabditis nigoni]